MPAYWSTFTGYPDEPIEHFDFTCADENHGPLPRKFIATGKHCRCPICGSQDVTEQPPTT